MNFKRSAAAAALLLVLLAGTAHAANVAVLDTEYDGAILAGSSHTVTTLTQAQVEAGQLALGNYDVLVIGHTDSGMNATVCSNISSFVQAGGGLILEWSAVEVAFDNFEVGVYNTHEPHCGFFLGNIGEGGSVGADTPIDILINDHPIVAGLSDPFSMGGGSDFMYTISGYEAPWSLVAEYDGHSATWSSIMTRAWGNGLVIVATMDFFDVLPGNANAETLMENMIAAAVAGPAVSAEIPALSTSALVALALALVAAVIFRLR